MEPRCVDREGSQEDTGPKHDGLDPQTRSSRGIVEASPPVHPADERVFQEGRNHVHAVALFATYYDFVGVYKTLRVTPAMAAGVSDRLWEVADIVALVGSAKAPARKRGPDKNREHKSALL